MSTKNIPKRTTTPRRTTPIQALASIFRTPTRLYTPTAVSRNKRTRALSTPTTPSIPSTPSSLPAVVLETYSVSTDSIVLTALSSAPFCCHEDLLTMSRAQLESVVRALNGRLPRRMQIRPEDSFWENDVHDDDAVSRMSEAEIKRRIEELVGIRAVVGKNRVSKSGLGLDARVRVPPAPKAVRTRDAGWRMYERTPWEIEVDDVEDQAGDLNGMIEESLIGSSPLAGRTTHSRGRNSVLSRLPILQEVNEGGDSKEDDDDSEDGEGRPSKRLRASLGNVTRDSNQGSQMESRLVENMDLSGSPLLAAEDDASSDNLSEFDERMVTTRNLVVGANRLEGSVQTPLQRRRSARIKEIALKRASSVDTGKMTDLKASILRSKTFSSRRSQNDNPISLGEYDARRDSKAPREFAIRLPFTSTPPHQKPTWSAPRILRSHSQRLSNSSQSIKTQASSLRRARSEKYPRVSDLTFVTINRPRYRFAQRKQKDTRGDQNRHSSPAHVGGQSRQIGTEHASAKHVGEKENSPLKLVSKSSTMSGLHASALPSALCNFLSPRSRAPSTSTIASTRSLNGGDSPTMGITQTPALSDGATECVWEALGRMAVDSV